MCVTQILSICDPRGGMWLKKQQQTTAFYSFSQCAGSGSPSAPYGTAAGLQATVIWLGELGQPATERDRETDTERERLPLRATERGSPTPCPVLARWFHFAPVSFMLFAEEEEESILADFLLPQVFQKVSPKKVALVLSSGTQASSGRHMESKGERNGMECGDRPRTTSETSLGFLPSEGFLKKSRCVWANHQRG